MAFDPKKFVGDILTGVTLDAQKKEVLEQVASDPTIANKLKELYENGLRQEDYSRKMNELDKTKTQIRTYYDSLTKWKEGEEKRFTEELQRVKRQLAGDSLYEEPSDKGLNSDDLQKKLDALKQEQQATAQNMFAYQNNLTQIGLQHMKEFNSVLDVNKLVAFSNERGLDISRGYEAFVADDRSKRANDELQEQLRKAREEGAVEALKNANVPIATSNLNGPIHATVGLDASTKGQFGALAAVKDFMDMTRNGSGN